MQCEEWADANSELFKEAHDETVHKNSYKRKLYELISASLYKAGKVRYLLQSPGNHNAQSIGHGNPDDRINERNTVHIFQKNMGINYVGQISCNFFKQHDAERHAAKEYQRLPRLFRHMMSAEPPAAGAEDKSGIQKEEGIVEPFGNGLGHSPRCDAVVPGHGAGGCGTEESSDSQFHQIPFRQPALGQHVFNPVAHEEVKSRLAHRQERIQEIIHFRTPLENEERHHGHHTHKEQVQTDEVQIKLLIQHLHQLPPDGKHEEERNIDI